MERERQQGWMRIEDAGSLGTKKGGSFGDREQDETFQVPLGFSLEPSVCSEPRARPATQTLAQDGAPG